MAFNEKTAQRIREILLSKGANFTDKTMFSGICFMVDNKMCCGTHIDKKTDEEYYADLEAFAKGYLIEQVVIDPSAASFKETIRRHGKFSVKNAKNDVLDGIRDTGTMLQAGLLHFNKTCVNTKAEFGAYAWDEKSSSDAVIKENDHSMDQMRYFVRTIMKREVRAYGIK